MTSNWLSGRLGIHYSISMILCQAPLATAAALSLLLPAPEPAKPQIQAGWDTTNLFWPGEVDAVTNVTYACTYVGMVVQAGDRVLAFGGCSIDPAACNGYHTVGPRVKAETNVNKSTCIKHSDDSCRSWSPIRMDRGGRKLWGVGIGLRSDREQGHRAVPSGRVHLPDELDGPRGYIVRRT